MANEFVARKGIISIGIISGSGNLDIIGNGIIGGNLTVGGTLTAQSFNAELISSSIIYESGSTKFGDTLDDTHQRTGSFFISGTAFTVTSSTFSINSPTITLSGSTTTVLGQFNAGNIRIDDGNFIYSTNTNGNIVLSPDGLGEILAKSSYLLVGGANNGTIATENDSGFDLILGVDKGNNANGPVIRLRNRLNPISSPISGGLDIMTTNGGATGSVIISSSGFGVSSKLDTIVGSLILGHEANGRSNFLVNTSHFKTTNSGSTLTLGFSDGNINVTTGSLRLSTVGDAGDLYYASVIPPYGASLLGNVTHELPYSSGRLALVSSSENFTMGDLTIIGNAKLGDAITDAHTVTGSLGISGSLNINGTSTFGNVIMSNITSSNISASGTISASSLSLANALPVSSGGTGATSFTSNALLYGNGTSAIQTDTFLLYNSGTSTLTTKNLNITDTVKLGDALTDAHTITGSLGISGSLALNGNIISDITISKVSPNLTIAAAAAGSATLTLTPNATGGTGGIINVNSATLPLLLQTNSTTRIFVSSSGLVGINKTTANAQLDVNGNTIITGSLTVTSTSALQGITATTLTTTGNAKLGDTTTDVHTVTGSLSVSGSFNILQSAYGAQISSSIANTVNAVVASIPTGSFNGVFFDYTIGLSTTGRRVGTVLATWLPGGTNVEFTDFSTLDMGATGGVSMAADIATGNIRLRANNTSGATVEVRAITRAI